ncbi:ABC transporter substrate-binding protein [Leifsonia sp. LS1]|uniref:ABC transporter substrate-binding protein n=1 Tax=Leifsonia sp. LS1 TaxID=2828483 RepID=UPI001CFE44A0|nr:ABC transporter substrate-binding protein [Leifsonia sp. LS1]GIT82049.1 ABC transporter substrate-binding protein [Leifsonia sp. LS1]
MSVDRPTIPQHASNTARRAMPWKASLASIALLALGLVGCTADPGISGTTPSKKASTAIPVQTLDQTLHNQLPADIKSSGTINAVNQGNYPPYSIIADGSAPSGLLGDMSDALSQILGVKIEQTAVSGLAPALAGMQGNRYQLEVDPNGDYPERHTQATFIDYIQEHVLFAVAKGNPKNINGLDNTCGNRIAVLAGGSAEKTIKAQSDKCAAAGKPTVEVQSYQDAPSAFLAVQSGRADADFAAQGPLTYYIKQHGNKLELAGAGQANGLGATYQGAMVPAGSPLAPVILAAIQKLYANGTYDKIIAKWGLEGNKLAKPGINLSGQ